MGRAQDRRVQVLQGSRPGCKVPGLRWGLGGLWWPATGVLMFDRSDACLFPVAFSLLTPLQVLRSWPLPPQQAKLRVPAPPPSLHRWLWVASPGFRAVASCSAGLASAPEKPPVGCINTLSPFSGHFFPLSCIFNPNWSAVHGWGRLTRKSPLEPSYSLSLPLVRGANDISSLSRHRACGPCARP